MMKLCYNFWATSVQGAVAYLDLWALVHTVHGGPLMAYKSAAFFRSKPTQDSFLNILACRMQ